MNSHFLVCECNETLLARLGGRSLVIRIGDFDEISKANDYSMRFNFHIHCLWVHSRVSLAATRLDEKWKGIPIALFVPALGHFPDLVRQLPVVRQLNIRVYLPGNSPSNFSALRILSSLGIESAVVFPEREQDWERMGDLMTYALLGLAPHAPIAPFNYIASRYEPAQRNNWQSVYFNDPSVYFHIDEHGHVAMSHEELKRGEFILDSVDKLDSADECAAYTERLQSWTEYFLKTEECAYCEGWRVCLGAFSSTSPNRQACGSFFTDFMESVERYRFLAEKKKEADGKWQP